MRFSHTFRGDGMRYIKRLLNNPYIKWLFKNPFFYLLEIVAGTALFYQAYASATFFGIIVPAALIIEAYAQVNKKGPWAFKKIKK